jgi:hypothetical protein
VTDVACSSRVDGPATGSHRGIIPHRNRCAECAPKHLDPPTKRRRLRRSRTGVGHARAALSRAVAPGLNPWDQ